MPLGCCVVDTAYREALSTGGAPVQLKLSHFWAEHKVGILKRGSCQPSLQGASAELRKAQGIYGEHLKRFNV